MGATEAAGVLRNGKGEMMANDKVRATAARPGGADGSAAPEYLSNRVARCVAYYTR